MPSQPPPSPTATTEADSRAAMQADFQRFVDAKVEERLSGIRPATRLLLAMAPAWNPETLERAGLIPRSSAGLLSELVRRGVLERTDQDSAAEPSKSTLYSMRVQTRADILERLGTPSTVQKLLAEIANSLRSATLKDAPNAFDDPARAPFDRFVELMARYSSDSARRPMIQYFDARVAAALNPSQPGPPLESRINEVRRWIAAARPIADLLPRANDTSLELAIERAVCKVEVSRRDERDREHLGPRLERFVRRVPSEDAFRALMGRDDSGWALHYIGGGGVGKTTLIRYICVHLARQFGCAVARIDFDYLNPDYPRFAPGLLLQVFAEELTAHDDAGRASGRFAEASLFFDQLHELLSQHQPATSERPTDHPLFRSGLSCYADALRDIGKPVLLIVDTCEELGKLRPDGRAPESVRETFAILEALQGEVPSLRVIFSGRRPLASGGFGGWSTTQTELGTRPYLRVHEIRGFTPDESAEFLSQRMGLAPNVSDAIRQRTQEINSDADIIPTASNPRHAHEPRCNPYELRLFAEWARETPAPTPAEILACDDDRYVEVRIIGRIANERIRSLLSLLALMGQAERNTLRAALASDVTDDEFDAVFRELCRQEWNSEIVSPIPGGDGSWHFVQVRGSIRRRLSSWCAKHENHQLTDRAVAELQRQTLFAPLEQLDWTIYDALLRLLMPSPARAIELWLQASTRALNSHRGPTWMLEITRRLLGSDGVFGTEAAANSSPTSSAVRAEVLATHASGLLHGDGTITELHDCWMEVFALTTKHTTAFPSPSRAAALRFRAAAALTGLAEKFGEPITDRADEFVRALQGVLESQSDRLTADQIASAVVALDAIVERAEANDPPQASPSSGTLIRSLCRAADHAAANAHADPVGELFERIELSLAREMEGAGPLDERHTLRATFLSLFARARFLERDYSRTPYPSDAALPPGAERGRWSDWITPDDPHWRLVLTNALASYPRVQGHDVWRQWRELGDGPSNSIDEDRCRSFRLRMLSAAGPLDQRTREALCAAADSGVFISDSYVRYTTNERCHAHYAALPHCLEAARTLAGEGEPDRAQTLLQSLLSGSSFGASVRAIQALEEIARRFRLRDANLGIRRSSRSRESISIETLAALDGFDGPRRRSHLRNVVGADDPRSVWREFHAVWRGIYAGEDRHIDPNRASDRLVEILDWFEENYPKLAAALSNNTSDFDPAGTDFDAMMVRLDLEEATLLGPRLSRTRAEFPLREFVPLDVDPVAWLIQNRDMPEQAIRLAVRLMALRPTSSAGQQLNAELLAVAVTLGLRRAAEIALDEGELLALRLPERATPILQLAAQWFQDVHDHTGSTMARTLAILPNPADRSACHADRVALLENLRNTPLFGLLASESNPHPFALTSTWAEASTIPPPSFFTSDSLARLGRHQTSGWYPWLARVLMALCPHSQPEVRALHAWLEESFGLRSSDGRVLLSAEMTMWGDRARWLLDQGSKKDTEGMSGSGPVATSAPPSAPSQARANSEAPATPRSRFRGVFASVGRFAPKWIGIALGLGIVIGIPLAVIRIFWSSAANLAHGKSPTIESYPSFPMLGLIFMTLLFWSELRRSRRVGPWIVVFTLVLAVQGVSPIPFLRPFNWLAWFAWSAGTALGIVAIYRAYRLLKAGSISRLGVRLKITTERPLEEIGAQIRPQFVRANLSWVGSPWLSSVEPKVRLDMPEDTECLAPTTSDYAKLAARLDPRVSTALQRYSAVINPLATDTQIVCDEGGDGPCWEAIFQPAREPDAPDASDTWLATSPFLFRREPLYFSSRRTEILNLRNHRAICWSDEHDASAQGIFSAWQPEWKKGTGSAAVFVLDDTPQRAASVVKSLESAQQNQEVRLLHLLGDTEITSTGLVWRIGGPVPDRFSSRSGSNRSESPSVAGHARPEEILRQFQALQVCVLQSVDRTGLAPRRETDRAKAFQAREFASELANGGVPLVLVLPPLEASLAAECMRHFVSELLKNPRGGREFAQIAHQLRLLVLGRAPIPAQGSISPEIARTTAHELALDLCLYCASDLNSNMKTSKTRLTTSDQNAVPANARGEEQ